MELAQRTKEICRLYDIKPSRSKGQNFLINEKIYDEIVAAANIKKTDIVLEVGPGLGILTTLLAKIAKRVVAVELDDKLADFLQVGLDAGGIKNVEVINQDVLKFNPKELAGAYKVVANLPYNITSLFLRSYLERANRPDLLVLMLQQEVARRIIAQPGNMSLLALSIQIFADSEIIREVKAGNFWPKPEVDSAVVRIMVNPKKIAAIPTDKIRSFFRLAKIGFSAKRKMLKNNLAGGLHIDNIQAEIMLEKAGISRSARAEDLSVSEWQKLFLITEK